MSEHAERTILGAMLVDAVAVVDAVARLDWQDFSLTSYRDLFRKMEEMAGAGQSIDAVTVSAALGKSALLEMGGVAWLFSLSEDIPRHLAIKEYVSLVQERATGRRAALACQQSYKRLLDPLESVSEVIDELSQSLQGERKQESENVAQVMPGAMEFLDQTPERFSTGIPELDDFTKGGIRPKELWVIGALPSAGKSALLRQIERGVMRHGVHSHSIEVPKEDWVRMHVGFVAGIDSWKLREPEMMSPTEKEKMRMAAADVSRWNHLIDDAGSVNVRTLIAKSRLSAIRQGIRVHTVDYLQMLDSRGGTRHEQMGNAARDLKRFAKDHNCAVILLSQLGEGRANGNEDNRPSIKDLKESGDIRQAADVVILNYRPKKDDTYTGEDELIVAKQRNGRIGHVNMFYDSLTLTFKGR